MKYPFFLVFFFCSLTLIFQAHFSTAQTGPGGVGSSDDNVMWLDPFRLNLDNEDTVFVWNDFSGNNNHASYVTPSTAPKFISNGLNGHPVINFINLKRLVTGSISELDTTSLSWIVVGLAENTSATRFFLRNSYTSGAGTYSERAWCTAVTQSNNFIVQAASSVDLVSLTSPVNYNFNILTAIWDRNSEALFYYRNSNFEDSTAGANADLIGHNFMRIGMTSHSSGGHLIGDIAEIIVYTKPLNHAERIIVDNYLSSKYDLTILNDYYSYEGTGHYYELFGVGQDSSQTHTESRGTGIVTFSNPTGLANEEFLLSAHNNESLTANESDLPSEYLAKGGLRLNRTWRVDKTAGIGTVDVSFDITGITLGQASNYELLISSDGDFSTATSHTTGLDYDSVAHTVSFTDVDFTAGDYYTLGNYGPYVNFAHLKRKHDGTYCEAREGVLHFQFTEEYAASEAELDFIVYDKEREVALDSTDINLEKSMGDNRFVLDVSSLDDGEFYTLEIKNDKGEKRVLRFKKIADE